MPIYITRGRYSAESIKNLVANPEDRLPAVRNLVEAAGAKLLNFYVTLGHYDFLLITEAPSAKEASAFILSRFQRGGQRMLSVIPSHSLVRDADHGGQIPCCRKRRAAA